MEHVAIIGAGITGLVVADGLRRRGVTVTVFEKSFAPGGRMATRRVIQDGRAPFFLDHGTPWLHPEGEDFRTFVDALVAEGHAASWAARGFVGLPHMNTALDGLAAGLDIRTRTRVDRIVAQGDRWTLELAPHDTEGGEARGREGPFDRVVVAVPVDQAMKLVPDEAMVEAMSKVVVDPCWTLLVAANALPDGPPIEHPEAGPLAVISRPSSKPGRTGPQTLVAHSTPEWAREHLEMDREAVLPLLVGALPFEVREPIYAAAHRWRYSQARVPLAQPCLTDADRRMICAGDWCLGPFAEDGYRSARAVLASILHG